MSIANAVAPHLPYLRRFARALTGDPGKGDAYVGSRCWRHFIADPTAFDRRV